MKNMFFTMTKRFTKYPGFIALVFLFPAMVSGNVYTLKDCIDMAEKNNFSVLKSRENILIAQSQNLLSYSEMLPYANVNSSVTRNSSVFGIDPYTDTYSENISLNQTVLDISSIYDIRSSRIQVKESVSSFKAVRNEVEFSVASSFFDFLRKRKLLGVKELGFKESEENFRKANVMFDVGSISKLDLLRSEVVRNQSELDLLKAKRDMELSRENLAYLIGSEPGAEFDVKEESLLVKEYNMEDYEKLLGKIKESNPGIEASRLSILKSRAQLSSSYCKYLPKLSVQGSYGYSGDKFSFSKDDWQENDSWSIGTSVTLPLFTGFSRMANVEQNKTTVRIRELDLADAVAQKAIELRKSLLAMDEAKRSLALSGRNFEKANLSYRMMQEKYDLGAATMIELMDAEQGFEQAQVTQISAYYDYLLASFYVTNMLGERIQ